MHRDAYTGVFILIVGFITINYISKEFIFEEKRLIEIFENKFSSKITRYTVHNKRTIIRKGTSYLSNRNPMGVPVFQNRCIEWWDA